MVEMSKDILEECSAGWAGSLVCLLVQTPLPLPSCHEVVDGGRDIEENAE